MVYHATLDEVIMSAHQSRLNANRRYREKMRAMGLRPIQIWVRDVRQSGFAEECRRQSLLLRGDTHHDSLTFRAAHGSHPQSSEERQPGDAAPPQGMPAHNPFSTMSV